MKQQNVTERHTGKDNEQHRRWMLRKVADVLPAGMKLLDSAYHTADRPKLSHIWVAEKLGINQHRAWAMLEVLATLRYRCEHVRGKRSPIRWSNDPALEEERKVILDNIIKKRTESGETTNT